MDLAFRLPYLNVLFIIWNLSGTKFDKLSTKSSTDFLSDSSLPYTVLNCRACKSVRPVLPTAGVTQLAAGKVSFPLLFSATIYNLKSFEYY